MWSSLSSAVAEIEQICGECVCLMDARIYDLTFITVFVLLLPWVRPHVAPLIGVVDWMYTLIRRLATFKICSSETTICDV